MNSHEIKQALLHLPQDVLAEVLAELPAFQTAIEKAIPEALAKALSEKFGGGAKNDERIPDKWVFVKDAWHLLGYTSAEQLREDIRSGLLRLGYEVRDKRRPSSSVARYQVNLHAVDARLRQRPEKRAPLSHRKVA